MIEVIQPGITTVQDCGRNGLQDHGMPPSGVFDPFLSAIANQTAGSAPSAPLLEFALLGPSLKFQSDCSFAIAGYDASFQLNNVEVAAFEKVAATAGSILRFKQMKGWFGYIAISGGIHAERIFGSVSTYERAGIGSRLNKQSIIRFDKPFGLNSRLRKEFLNIEWNHIVPILPGYHFNQFSDRSKELLVSTDYKISLQSDRMGIRLDGAALETPRILRSMPALPGTVQITTSGLPLILGPEGPVTGGYPQIAVLPEISWTILAGNPPGKSIRFAWMQVDEARSIRDLRNSIFTNENVKTE